MLASAQWNGFTGIRYRFAGGKVWAVHDSLFGAHRETSGDPIQMNGDICRKLPICVLGDNRGLPLFIFDRRLCKRDKTIFNWH